MAEFRQPRWLNSLCTHCGKQSDLWYAGNEEEVYRVIRCARCGTDQNDRLGDYCERCGEETTDEDIEIVEARLLCKECFEDFANIRVGDKCIACGRWDELIDTEIHYKQPEELSLYSAILTEDEQQTYFRDRYEDVRICGICKSAEDDAPSEPPRLVYSPKSNILEDFTKRSALSTLAVTIVQDIFQAAGYKTVLRGVEQTRPYLTGGRVADPSTGYRKAMSEPDLEVSDKASSDLYMVEVKATTQSPADYRYTTSQLAPLIMNHKDAILLVYHIPSGQIVAQKVKDIDWGTLPLVGSPPSFKLQFATLGPLHDINGNIVEPGVFTDLPTLFDKVTPDLIKQRQKFMCELFRKYFIGLELSHHFTMDSL